MFNNMVVAVYANGWLSVDYIKINSKMVIGDRWELEIDAESNL